jgi:hypothetical protein
MKPITGQYECMHHSGIGLDYFTSRIDRLVLYPDGRFTLTVHQMSRAANAAKSWLNKQTVNHTPAETRQEGHYTQQQNSILLYFDNGGFEEAQLSQNADGIQVGPNYFPKVSDSPVLPSAQRVKQDMDDIAKGLKIASTLGNIATKAAKTLQGTIGAGQSQASGNPSTAASSTTSSATNTPQPRFCDQCGERVRPGKHFCSHCGARIT